VGNLSMMPKAHPANVQRLAVIVVVSLRNRITTNLARLSDKPRISNGIANSYTGSILLWMPKFSHALVNRDCRLPFWAVEPFPFIFAVMVNPLSIVICNVSASAVLALAKMTITHCRMTVEVI
jgi:hypothetical protein